MEEVGVTAVVKELQKFLGDMNKMDSALNGLRPSGSLLQQMFEGIGGAVSDFGQKIWDVASVTIGVMLRDAIEGIISLMGEFIQSIIDAGNEFQMLKIRLTGMNLNDVSNSTKSFNEAMSESINLTEQQMTWLQTLGAATPFDPAAITNVYTMARSYGFAAEEAKRLTKDTIEYTAGMGLSNDVLELVIRNMGQMVQRGKITSTEMRDLARGSYMPLSDILERVAKNMGITVSALTKAISKPGEGVPAQEFIKAFEAMVEEEPRFVGAAGRLSRALVPAANNVKELFTSVLGLNVVTPIFDVLGQKVASFIDEFVTFNQQGDLVKTEKWTALVDAATELGKALTGVLTEVLGLVPSSSILSDSLLGGMKAVTEWVNTHRADIVGFFEGAITSIRDDLIPFIRDRLIPALVGIVTWIWNNREIILGFFQGIGDIITNTVVPFIQNQLVPAFNLISAWVVVNKPLIDEFFNSVATIMGNVFAAITGGPKPGEGSPLLSILNSIANFMGYVNEHQEDITKLVEVLWSVFIVTQVLITIFNIIVGVVGAVIGVFVSLILAVTTVVGVIALFSTGIGAIILVLAGFGVAIAAIVTFVILNWTRLSTTTSQLVVVLEYYFITLMTNVTTTMNNLWISLVGIFTRLWADLVALGTAIWSSIKGGFDKLVANIKSIDWGGVGRSIISGIANGISSTAGILASAAVNAARSAYSAAKSFLGIRSPSTLFMEMGELTMQGMAKGIENMAGLASQTMTNAVSKIAMPAITMPSLIQTVMAQNAGGTTNNTDTKNFNLTVNSGANTEPIVQDFNMMQSLAGV